jgi:two-component system OmpR family sensor kinase/two-component system sensor histidine kinase BaeS
MNRLWIRNSLAISAIFIFFAMCPWLVLGILERLGVIEMSTIVAFYEKAVAAMGLIPVWLYMTLILVCIPGIIAGFVASRKVIAPITKLAQAAQMIGERKFDQRVMVKGPQEILDLAQAFNQMASDLELAAEKRRILMADVSHELRTPLTVLEGNLRAALDHVYELNDEELANLYSQTHHLIRLVNDLHEISQAETKQLPLNITSADVMELIQQTSDMFTPMVEEKKITLTCDLPAELPPVMVDIARLRQVLHNLLANAVRHTPSAGTITIKARRNSDTVQIAVIDSGEGIAPEHMAHVFDRFYRTDQSRSRETGGTGLGLAIARAIIEAHEGMVTATSEGLDCGSTFTITLPLPGQ